MRTLEDYRKIPAEIEVYPFNFRAMNDQISPSGIWGSIPTRRHCGFKRCVWLKHMARVLQPGLSCAL